MATKTKNISVKSTGLTSIEVTCLNRYGFEWDNDGGFQSRFGTLIIDKLYDLDRRVEFMCNYLASDGTATEFTVASLLAVKNRTERIENQILEELCR